MARIPEAELERLKREVSLVRLIQSQGHELKKRGKDWVMHCVFHDESTPSLSVSEEKKLYHCFGCGAAGSVIDWVMKTQGVSLPHAVQLLRNDAPLENTEKVGVTRSHARHLPSLAAGASDLEAAALLRSVAEFYHGNFKQSPEALAYLESRGLNHPELIEHFQLGYANKTLTYRLPAGHTQAGRQVRQQLQTLGVLRSTGHEHLNGCLVVPVLGLEDGAQPEQSGRVMQLYGRRMQPNNKLHNQPRHLYLTYNGKSGHQPHQRPAQERCLRIIGLHVNQRGHAAVMRKQSPCCRRCGCCSPSTCSQQLPLTTAVNLMPSRSGKVKAQSPPKESVAEW